ncbi:MAG: hypothetical protein ABFD80_11765, partial [Acidobacteriota bacterium]
MDDRTLQWLAFHLAFLSSRGAGRRALDRFGDVGKVVRARAPDLDGLGLPEGAVRAVAGGE